MTESFNAKVKMQSAKLGEAMTCKDICKKVYVGSIMKYNALESGGLMRGHLMQKSKCKVQNWGRQ